VLDVPGLGRRLKVYGSSMMPRYDVSAFQTPRAGDVWTDRVADDTKIIVTRGPPLAHFDGARRAGCTFLAREIARVRPRLVVCGHIHVAYGREDVVFGGVRRMYEGIEGGWVEWWALGRMALGVLKARSLEAVAGREKMVRREMFTTIVDAVVIGGPKNELVNKPWVVDLCR